MGRKSAESKRFKITQGDKVYYTYGPNLARAENVFVNSPQWADPFTIKLDNPEEWKTTLQDGRLAPGK